MEYVALNNGVKMPFVGLGVYRLNEADDAYNAVRSALDLGYEHIDTAMFYFNEEAVGKAIRDSGIERSKIFLTTKLWPTDIRANKVKEAVDLSMEKLQVDYLDLYLIHWPEKEHYVSVWSDMEKIYASGKTRAIGISNYLVHHVNDLLEHCSVIPMVNQFEIQPYFIQEELINLCKKNKIQPVAHSQFCPKKNGLLEEPVLVELAHKYGKTTAQIVLRWNVERGVVLIPKSSNRERQAQNLEIFDFSLTNEDINRINALNRELRLGSDPDSYPY